MPFQQSDCTLAASLVSCQHRTDGTTHVTRQIDGDSGWCGGVRLASGRAAAAASNATKPRASDTTMAWPVYLTVNCAHCWPTAGMHLLKLQCRSIVWLLAGLFDGVAADSEPSNTAESDTDTDTEN